MHLLTNFVSGYQRYLNQLDPYLDFDYILSKDEATFNKVKEDNKDDV